MNFRQAMCTSAGVLMVGLGSLGIFLPLLPTTPFLLLAAYLFARSSRRLHDWLLHHRHLGPYIHAWRSRSGFTVAQKLRIGLSFSVLMGISIYFAPMTALRCLLVGGWVFWMFMLLRQKTIPVAAASAGE